MHNILYVNVEVPPLRHPRRRVGCSREGREPRALGQQGGEGHTILDISIVPLYCSYRVLSLLIDISQGRPLYSFLADFE